MVMGLITPVVGLTTLIGVVPDAAVQWSPDGSWVTYKTSARSVTTILDQFPLFELLPESADDRSNRASEPSRIWATRVDDQRSLLIDETEGSTSAPIWTPDGYAVSYCRVEPSPVDLPGDSFEFQVLIGEPGNLEVIYQETVPSEAINPTGFSSQLISWDRTGNRLLAPLPSGDRFILIDLEDPLTVRRFQGQGATWSPAGDEIAYYQSDPSGGFELLVSPLTPIDAAPQHISLVERADQPPIWTSGGQSLLFLNGTVNSQGDRVYNLECYRGPDEPLIRLKDGIESRSLGQQLQGLSMSIGADGFKQIYAINVENIPSVMFYHLGRASKDLLHPYVNNGVVRLPSLSPDGNQLAFRLDSVGNSTVAGLLDPETLATTPLRPDLAATAEWILALGAASNPDRGPYRLSTRLPMPSTNGQRRLGRQTTIERLATLGIRLTESASEQSADQENWAAPIAFFSYLSGDFERSSNAVDALLKRTESPEDRVRLLGLRAQIAIAEGDVGQARSIIGFLETLQDQKGIDFPVSTSESASANPLNPIDQNGWIEDLRRVQELRFPRLPRFEAEANRHGDADSMNGERPEVLVPLPEPFRRSN